MEKKWPDLRVLNAAIAFIEADGDKYRGVAVMISNAQARKSGMTLLKEGFSLNRTDGRSSLYCNRNLSKFSVSDLKRWFPGFDSTLMMGTVDEIPLIDDIHTLMPTDDIDDVMAQAAGQHSHQSTLAVRIEDAAVLPRFGVTSSGVLWISAAACEKQGYPTREECLAALYDFNRKRYGDPVTHRLSPADVKTNIAMIIKQKGGADRVVDLFYWAVARFVGNERHAIDQLVTELKKSEARHLLEDPSVLRCLRSLERFTSSEDITPPAESKAQKTSQKTPEEQPSTQSLF